jgi:hypothetical protein
MMSALRHDVRIYMTLAALMMLSCSQSPSASERSINTAQSDTTMPTPTERPGRQPVEVEMSNVDLHVTSDITLNIRHLRGRFVTVGRAEMPVLDDKHSYVVAIDSAEIALSMASLNALMSRTLGHGQSNVEKVQLSIDDQRRLRQRGVLDKGIDVPFDVKGAIDATPDGRIRVHASNVRGFGVPVTPLMKVFGVEMDDLLKVKPGHGVTVDDNDLILDPEQLVPPPLIRGKVTSVRITDNALVQTFGDGQRRRLSPLAVSKNYIYWRGGDLRFGKLTMIETDLELIDEDPNDPFDFWIDHWNDQLVAGYSKNTPSRGLKAHMPDYNDLSRPAIRK